ncbi:MAG: hypothetical protein CMH54_00470 [Myxococcales bacterium]|nr:hypothetical protein [Myxococcales bacterium]
MAQETAAERTEEPTPRRRQKARDEGQVAKSSEVVSALIMGLVTVVIFYWMAYITPGLVDFTQSAFRLENWREIEHAGAPAIVRSVGAEIARIVIPVALVTGIISLLANLAQVGLSVNWELCNFKWDRLNPLNWFKKMFSLELPVELTKALFKGLGVITIAILGLLDEPYYLGKLMFSSLPQLGEHMRDLAAGVFFRVTLAMVALAIIDYLWTRMRHEQKIRMTRQEIRDEMKEMEGDPYQRAAQRRRGREMVQEALASNVRGATVVVRNPTHFAVALRYERQVDESPKVVAKGRGYKALRIIALAQEADIPVIEDRPLARTLYRSVKVGKTVPVELYRAVARLFAALYKSQGVAAENLT